MTKKTIAELPDGELIRKSSALVAFIQDGVTSNSTAAQLPTKTIHARTQAQLEASVLGTNLELPDDEILKIILDDSITLTKPFKLGDDSSLEIVGPRPDISIDYTGVGAMFQNTIPGTDDADDLILRNLSITGDDTNDLFNLEVTSILIDTVNFADFKNLGIIENPRSTKFLDIRTLSIPGAGLVITNPSSLEVVGWTVFNSGATGITALSILVDSPPSNPPVISLDDFIGNIGVGDAMLFLDPTLADINYTITRCPAPEGGGTFYQQGSLISITAVADNGGILRCTSTAHGLPDGKVVVLSDFAEITYNSVARITKIDDDTFDVEEIIFVPGADSGNFNAISLTQKDNRVTAFNNRNQPDSMTIAESRSLVTISFLSAIATFTPIQKTVPIANDFVEDQATERFLIDDTTGIITYDGSEPITAAVNFEFLISKVGGGTDNAIISLFKNGTEQQTKTDQPIPLTSTVQKVIYSDGIFEISPGDTFQLFLDSDTVSTINVSALKVVIKKQ